MLMVMMIILSLLLKTQNYMFQQETIKNYQNFIARDSKGPFVGMKIKQKVIIKIRQTNLNTVSNQIFLEAIDHLFQFIETKMLLLKDLKLKGITYQNKLLIIITSSSLEKTFIINQLILIQSDGKNLEIQQKGKVKIALLGIYQVMIIQKIIID